MIQDSRVGSSLSEEAAAAAAAESVISGVDLSWTLDSGGEFHFKSATNSNLPV